MTDELTAGEVVALLHVVAKARDAVMSWREGQMAHIELSRLAAAMQELGHENRKAEENGLDIITADAAQSSARPSYRPTVWTYLLGIASGPPAPAGRASSRASDGGRLCLGAPEQSH